MSKTSLICLSLLLCGCQSEPRILYETIVEKVRPGDALLVRCDRTTAVPELRVEDIYTNRDAFEAGEGKCADRMDKLIDWYNADGSPTE